MMPYSIALIIESDSERERERVDVFHSMCLICLPTAVLSNIAIDSLRSKAKHLLLSLSLLGTSNQMIRSAVLKKFCLEHPYFEIFFFAFDSRLLTILFVYRADAVIFFRYFFSPLPFWARFFIVLVSYFLLFHRLCCYFSVPNRTPSNPQQ